VDFRYEIYGVGWARARIRDGASEVRLRASYLGDALGDLLETLVYLLWGAEIAQCSWEEEPGLRVHVEAFLVDVDPDWEPVLNEEHVEYRWLAREEAAELLFWPEPAALLRSLQ